MRARRSAAVEPRTTAAGGTPWKGRLRSHHETTQSVPTQRLPSHAKNREVQTSKKRSALQNTGRGRNAGPARSPGATRCLSMRLTGSDPEHPIVIDELSEECKGRDNQLASKPLRRSPRFHPENKNSGTHVLPPDPDEITHNRKTEKAIRKDKSQESLKRNKRNSVIKSQKEQQEPCQGPKDIPPTNKIADVSHKKSGKQQVDPSHCEVLTGKRKRGIRGKSSLKRQSCLDPESFPSNCQETVPSNEPRKSIDRKEENDPSIVRHLKIAGESLVNVDGINKVASGIHREGTEDCCGSDGWTKEQDMALRNAYFTARPSPHFWKRVSKMVPGRSAEECFNRIHADLSTPTPIAPRLRTSKTFSPLGKFTLSDSKLPNLLEPTVARHKTVRQKSLAAQKTVRHLLRKHCLIDHAQEADHFSVFETSPSAIQLNISLEDSPGSPDSYMNSVSLNKCSGSSSAQKKPLSRLRAKQAEPSPAVLKPVKNAALHERYINQLSRREGTKGSRKRTLGSNIADSEKTFSEKCASGLREAKSALISEATDFIGHFKKLQANSHAHIVENTEDDDTDCTDCDASDGCRDDKE